MSLYLFRDWAKDLDSMRPSRLLDQHFGLGLTPEDLVSPLTISAFRYPVRPNYYRPWRMETRDTGSTVQSNKDNFQVNLDVQQFSPEEITVKVIDDSVVVEGKHEEKQDEHGFISRHFVRRYVIPKEYKIDEVKSSLSSDGVLTIAAPKATAIESGERSIPIIHTGPSKAVKSGENNEEEAKQQ